MSGINAAIDQFDTGLKKGRGLGKASLDLIEALYPIVEAAQPISGRGVGYKLFTAGLSPSMARADMQRVYRLLKKARERGIVPWDWIVDETRELERIAVWGNPEEYARATIRDYRRDYWDPQPARVEVWSEKGTVRGVLRPVLDAYGIGFRVMHGFTSATLVHDVAVDYDGRELIVLYVGDWDPSGLWMSEHDLPERLSRYDGDHVVLARVALTRDHLAGIPSFPATDKRKDPRYKWFIQNSGNRCWELDALDPNDLRACVEGEIRSQIEPTAWSRCKAVEHAEQESLREVMASWGGRA
jgi:hypothetical protein